MHRCLLLTLGCSVGLFAGCGAETEESPRPSAPGANESLTVPADEDVDADPAPDGAMPAEGAAPAEQDDSAAPSEEDSTIQVPPEGFERRADDANEDDDSGFSLPPGSDP